MEGADDQSDLGAQTGHDFVHVGVYVNPGRLIDRLVDKFLDHIEQLSSLVVPAQADRPTYAKIEARVQRFGP